jgi:hypothetical protein
VVSRPAQAAGCPLVPAVDFQQVLAVAFPPAPEVGDRLALAAVSPQVLAEDYRPAPVVDFQQALAIIGAACPFLRVTDSKP